MPSPHFLRSVALLLALPALLVASDPRLDYLVYGPGPMPDRIVLTWTGDPATSQAVTWRTSVDAGEPLAQIARASATPTYRDVVGFADSARTVVPATVRLQADLGRALYHSAEFTGLEPETLYAYRVGHGDTWSEWFHFRTASREAKPFSFAYFGDAQNDVRSQWSRVIRQSYAGNRGLRFFLHAGDLINHADSDAEWGEWNAGAGWLNGMLPSVPTPGNHEYAKEDDVRRISRHWRPQFALPTHGPAGLEEATYFIDYQGVRLVSLNSNEMIAEQVPWLERVLSDNPNRWTVLTFHHPIFSAARNRDNEELRELWLPVIDRHGIDLVLQGHDHTYGRTGNIAQGSTVRDEARGTVFVVSVSGPKMYRSQEHRLMRRLGEDTQLYQVISVDGDSLAYRAYTAVGELYDAFDLHKRRDGTNRLVEVQPEVEARRRPPEGD